MGLKLNSNFETLLNEVELAVFHLNVRSHNSHDRELCQFLQMVCIKFDIVVLSQVWSYSIDCYLVQYFKKSV